MASLQIPTRVKLGSQGLEVSRQGLGCMSMSGHYGAPKPEQDMVALIHHAVLDLGITFLDTSDVYGPNFHNEILLGKALKGIRDKVQLATKFGLYYDDKGQFAVCGLPSYVRGACEASLKRLNVDYIDLYYQHRIDPSIPIEVTVGEMKKLVEEGKVKYLGLSDASASTIRRAHAIHPITAVQIEWSLWSRDVEDEIIPTCRIHGHPHITTCSFADKPGILRSTILGYLIDQFPISQNRESWITAISKPHGHDKKVITLEEPSMAVMATAKLVGYLAQLISVPWPSRQARKNLQAAVSTTQEFFRLQICPECHFYTPFAPLRMDSTSHLHKFESMIQKSVMEWQQVAAHLPVLLPHVRCREFVSVLGKEDKEPELTYHWQVAGRVSCKLKFG